jgi:glycosyl transferase family 1
MKILVCSFYYYYGKTSVVEPQFYYLYKVPQTMGHEVDFFDYPTATKIDLHQMRRSFLAQVKGGNYDAVFIATFKDEFDHETLAQAKKYSTIIAWNSDDEWRWDNYSKERVGWYTFMITNSPSIYEDNKDKYTNLLHAQWACTGFWTGIDTKKDIDFSFAGQVYGIREKEIKYLAGKANLKAYGPGTGNFYFNKNYNSFKTKVKNLFLRPVVPETVSFENINKIWNRTKISFTSLESSTSEVLQIKSRVFDMGLSGTVMLAPRTPYLDTYYEPNKEYIPFDNLADCVDKVKYYLKNETERSNIARAYTQRTKKEHMWKYRIHKILKETGLLK